MAISDRQRRSNQKWLIQTRHFLLASSSASFLLLSSCASVTPVNNHYEKAATLGQGSMETAVSLTNTVAYQYGRFKTINTNFGCFAGYGLLKKLDLKLQYEKLNPFSERPGVFVQEEYFSVIAKFSIVSQKAAIMLPVSSYKKYTRDRGGEVTHTITSVAPHFIYTLTNKAKTIDISAIAKADILMSQIWALNFGGNIGVGLSTDLTLWALRPEIGYYSDLAFENYFFWGLAFRYNFSFLRKWKHKWKKASKSIK